MNPGTKIYFASDHAGFELKNAVRDFVAAEFAYEVEDCGAFEYDATDDYPDFIKVAAANVALAPDRAAAIVFGGSGQGEAITANRFSNVRAAVYYGGPTAILSLSREHNNANVLSLGARFLDEAQAKEAVALWLSTAFPGEERHVRRIVKIDVDE